MGTRDLSPSSWTGHKGPARVRFSVKLTDAATGVVSYIPLDELLTSHSVHAEKLFDFSSSANAQGALVSGDSTNSRILVIAPPSTSAVTYRLGLGLTPTLGPLHAAASIVAFAVAAGEVVYIKPASTDASGQWRALIL